jgi:hypothetical protein
MKPEQIGLPPPDSSARQAVAQAEFKANAWRRAMEQEHARIAATARSVKAADMPHAATGSPDGRPTASATMSPAATGLTSAASVMAIPESGLLHLAASSRHNAGACAGPAGPVQGVATPGLGGWPAALRDHASTAARAHTGESDKGPQPAAKTVALLESRYRQQWPLKNVHMEHCAHGVRLWIRDPDLAPGAQCERLARQLASTLKADGRQLVGLTINGNIIL